MKRSRWTGTLAAAAFCGLGSLASSAAVPPAESPLGEAEAAPVALDDGAVELECNVKTTEVSLLPPNPLKVGLSSDCNTDGAAGIARRPVSP